MQKCQQHAMDVTGILALSGGAQYNGLRSCPLASKSETPMRAWAHSVALCALLTGAAACDTTPRGRDASAQSGQRMAEVSVRLEALNRGAPSVTVQAYRASVSGVNPDDVLPAVDPLVVQPPEASCVLRDVAGAARTLGAQGGRVELEALENLAIELGEPGVTSAEQGPDARPSLAGASVLKPTARVYPNLASVVGGVWAEAGPLDLEVAPSMMVLGDSGSRFAVPPMPRLALVVAGAGAEGAPLPAKLSANSDLLLSMTGPLRAAGLSMFVELRPFGATWALVCPTTSQPSGGERVLVPAQWLTRMAGLRVPVRIEAVARVHHFTQLGSGTPSATPAGTPSATSVRLTIEVRSYSELELVP
jgi:hypothetical protein